MRTKYWRTIITTIVFTLFGPLLFEEALCEKQGFSRGTLNIHSFPDEETLIQIETNVHDTNVIVIAFLDRPNAKLIPLLFTANTLRSLGAKHIHLVTPYLPYMRQDTAFHKGEGISSIYFAQMISTAVDAISTIDPHLHRWKKLDSVYAIPSKVLHAGDKIAHWIASHVNMPVLLGPDGESSQWIHSIAEKIQAPTLILKKERLGDNTVLSSIPETQPYHTHAFVIIDDIISTATTMIQAIHHLKSQGIQDITCIGIHALFAGNAYEKLLATGVSQVVTGNSIPHISNQIDFSSMIAMLK